MPTLVRSPFNQGGSYQADPFDSIDSGNRSAAMQAMQMNMGFAQNNALTQLALAQLKSGDYHYSQDRQDRNANQASLMGYLGHRDDIGDKRYQEQWQYNTDPGKNPFLQSQVDMNGAQTQLALQQVAQMKAANERMTAAGNASPAETNGVVAPVGATDPTGNPIFENNEESALYNSLKSQGQAPSQAYTAVLGSRDKRAQEELPLQETDLGKDIAAFNTRDNRMTGADPSQQEKAALEAKMAALEKALQVRLHRSPAAAKAEVDNVLRANAAKHGVNTGWTDSIFADRGLPKPNWE